MLSLLIVSVNALRKKISWTKLFNRLKYSKKIVNLTKIHNKNILEIGLVKELLDEI